MVDAANRGRFYAVGRVLHAAFVLAVVGAVVLPAAPKWLVGELGAELSPHLLKVSFRENWQMYAPNPQRAQLYMNLQAVYSDGRVIDLEETEAERKSWGTHAFWQKTRVDIWKQYANFHPKGRNANRVWYLKGVCVREARKGDVPHRIVMQQVRRSFTPPAQVMAGRKGLGNKKEEFITVQYCRSPQVLEMLEYDRLWRGA